MRISRPMWAASPHPRQVLDIVLVRVPRGVIHAKDVMFRRLLDAGEHHMLSRRQVRQVIFYPSFRHVTSTCAMAFVAPAL